MPLPQTGPPEDEETLVDPPPVDTLDDVVVTLDVIDDVDDVPPMDPVLDVLDVLVVVVPEADAAPPVPPIPVDEPNSPVSGIEQDATAHAVRAQVPNTARFKTEKSLYV